MLSAWLPVILFQIAIFAVSSRPNLDVAIPIRHLDKVAHLLEYAVLGGLLYRAMRLSRARRWVAFATAVLGAALMGGFDEGLQSLVPGRDCSLTDWFADCTGGWLGALGLARLEKAAPRALGGTGEDHARGTWDR
jgi:VanZ family protein